MPFIDTYGLVKYQHGMHRDKRYPRDAPCEICAWRNTKTILDHCHKHGWIRGWLCGKCNHNIQFFEDGSTGTAFLWERILRDSPSAVVEQYIHHVNLCPECEWTPRAHDRLGLFGWTTWKAGTTLPITPAHRMVAWEYAYKTALLYGTITTAECPSAS